MQPYQAQKSMKIIYERNDLILDQCALRGTWEGAAIVVRSGRSRTDAVICNWKRPNLGVTKK